MELLSISLIFLNILRMKPNLSNRVLFLDKQLQCLLACLPLQDVQIHINSPKLQDPIKIISTKVENFDCSFIVFPVIYNSLLYPMKLAHCFASLMSFRKITSIFIDHFIFGKNLKFLELFKPSKIAFYHF